MVSRWTVVALLLAVPALVLSGQSAGTASDFKTPAGSFDILPLLPPELQRMTVTVHHFRTGRRGLYFHVSGGPVAVNSVVLHTSSDGVMRNRFVPPKDAEVLDFDVDDQGGLHLLVSDKAKSRVLSYSASGKVEREQQSSKFAIRICQAKGDLILFAAEDRGVHVEVLSSNPVSELFIPLHQRSRTLAASCFPAGGAVLLERGSGVLHVIDAASGRATTAKPTLPEFAASTALRREHPALRNVVFAGIAAGSKRDLYLIAGRYKLTDGARVLRTATDGSTLQPVTYSLPTFEDERNSQNPTGYMSPSKIGLFDSRLFLVSTTGKVAFYLL
jgi:hypothetical protein